MAVEQPVADGDFCERLCGKDQLSQSQGFHSERQLQMLVGMRIDLWPPVLGLVGPENSRNKGPNLQCRCSGG